MKTGFYSDSDSEHEAKIARLHNERSIVDGEETWRSRLTSLFHSLLAAENKPEAARLALELAEAGHALEEQLAAEVEDEAKHPPAPAPAAAPAAPAAPAVVVVDILALASARASEEPEEESEFEPEEYEEPAPSAFDPEPMEPETRISPVTAPMWSAGGVEVEELDEIAHDLGIVPES